MAGCCGGSDASAQMRSDEENRQNLIRYGISNIDRVFRGFDEPFYQGRARAYEQFALPQLADQYRQTRDRMVYSLANKGILGGSAGQQLGSSLESETQKQKRAVVDTGQSMSQALQKQIADEQANLYSQLQASANPSMASTNALAAASRFQAPSPMQPIGQAFADWTNIYLQNRLNQQQQQGQQWQPPTNLGWMGSSFNTVR